MSIYLSAKLSVKLNSLMSQCLVVFFDVEFTKFSFPFFAWSVFVDFTKFVPFVFDFRLSSLSSDSSKKVLSKTDALSSCNARTKFPVSNAWKTVSLKLRKVIYHIIGFLKDRNDINYMYGLIIVRNILQTYLSSSSSFTLLYQLSFPIRMISIRSGIIGKTIIRAV